MIPNVNWAFTCEALVWLRTSVTYTLTDIKDSHSKSDNLTKSTQEIRHTPVLGGIRSCGAMYQRIRQEEQEDDIECRLKAVESKQG